MNNEEWWKHFVKVALSTGTVRTKAQFSLCFVNHMLKDVAIDWSLKDLTRLNWRHRPFNWQMPANEKQRQASFTLIATSFRVWSLSVMIDRALAIKLSDFWRTFSIINRLGGLLHTVPAKAFATRDGWSILIGWSPSVFFCWHIRDLWYSCAIQDYIGETLVMILLRRWSTYRLVEIISTAAGQKVWLFSMKRVRPLLQVVHMTSLTKMGGVGAFIFCQHGSL